MYITPARMFIRPKNINCKLVEAITEFHSHFEKQRRPSRESIVVDVHYENFMSVPVWIAFRNGTYSFIDKNVGSQTPYAFVATVTHNFRKASGLTSDISITDAYDVQTHNPTAAMVAVCKGIRERIRPHNYISIDTKTRYVVTEEEINQDPNGVYIEELDIVVSMNNSFPETLHPYCEAAKRGKAILKDNEAAQKKNEPQPLRYTVVIVDNDAKYNTRFIKIGSHVYEVPRVKDPKRENGVYVSGQDRVGGINPTNLCRRFYTMAEADSKLPLYCTAEEADSAHENTVKLKELELQQKTLQLKYDQLKHANEELLLKSEDLTRRAELDGMKLDVEHERIKDDAVRRQHEDNLKKEQDKRQRRHFMRVEVGDVAKLTVALISSYVTYKKLIK